ncbi:hypothetical protein GCM10010425_63210 [Streptomyces spororaveus]
MRLGPRGHEVDEERGARGGLLGGPVTGEDVPFGVVLVHQPGPVLAPLARYEIRDGFGCSRRPHAAGG